MRYCHHEKNTVNLNNNIFMEKTNIYGDISGWFLFDSLDRYAHEYARTRIWECVTANAYIRYLMPIANDDFSLYRIEYAQYPNKIEITVWARCSNKREPFVLATFLFVKTK